MISPGIARHAWGVVWGLGLIAWMLAAPMPAHAQSQWTYEDPRLREITVTSRQDGRITSTWPWTNLDGYFNLIMLQVLDPTVPLNMASVVGRGRDSLEIAERSGDGRLLRTFWLQNGFYRYSYYLYQIQYYDDLHDLGALLTAGLTRAPQNAPLKEKALVTINGSVNGQPHLWQIFDLVEAQRLKAYIDTASPIDTIEEMSIQNKFDGGNAVTVYFSPLLGLDWPTEVVINDGQIRATYTKTVSRLFEDKQNIWASAWAEKERYARARAQGTLPPKIYSGAR